MTSKDQLIRLDDNKVFKVALHGHWSDIESLDGTETDYVKWSGNDHNNTPIYVSHSKGFSYRVLKKD